MLPNNLVAFCGYGPLILANSSEEAIIRNNVFYNNGLKGGTGLYGVPTDEGSIVDYNLIWKDNRTSTPPSEFELHGVFLDPLAFESPIVGVGHECRTKLGS